MHSRPLAIHHHLEIAAGHAHDQTPACRSDLRPHRLQHPPSGAMTAATRRPYPVRHQARRRHFLLSTCQAKKLQLMFLGSVLSRTILGLTERDLYRASTCILWTLGSRWRQAKPRADSAEAARVEAHPSVHQTDNCTPPLGRHAVIKAACKHRLNTASNINRRHTQSRASLGRPHSRPIEALSDTHR